MSQGYLGAVTNALPRFHERRPRSTENFITVHVGITRKIMSVSFLKSRNRVSNSMFFFQLYVFICLDSYSVATTVFFLISAVQVKTPKKNLEIRPLKFGKSRFCHENKKNVNNFKKIKGKNIHNLFGFNFVIF